MVPAVRHQGSPGPYEDRGNALSPGVTGYRVTLLQHKERSMNVIERRPSRHK